MARAIDADALWKEVEPYGLHKGCILGKHGGLADILMDIIEKQPTISLAKQEWIRTKDRLPTEEDSTSGMVIAVENDKERRVKPWHWDIVVKYANEFTHWMPLPEPPERDGE